jgi:DNA-binding response OmpR family regulator
MSLVEDDPRIREALTRAMHLLGHRVIGAEAGLPGLRAIVAEEPDIVILDLGLPDIDGLELLRMIRAVSAVPVIIATARDDEADIISTLNAGADDYVVKPFSADQLDARVRAVLRRRQYTDGGASIRIGQLQIDPSSREVHMAGELVDLSRKEFDLLHYLATRPGKVVSKRELLASIWDQPYGGADKTVDVHLSWLRRKLGETARSPGYLRTVRGVGVKLVDPDT